MNNQFPEGEEQESSIEIQVDLTKYENFLQQVLEGKEIAHVSVKKQIGRMVADIINAYVSSSCVFDLEVPREVYKSLFSSTHVGYPRTLPVSFLHYIRQTSLAPLLGKLLDDKEYMFYAIVSYYFWKELTTRFKSFSFSSDTETVNPYMIVVNNESGFNPEMFDTQDIPRIMMQLKEAVGKEYVDERSEGNKKGRRDLGGRSNKDMELVIFKQKIRDQPQLVELVDIVIESARDRKILVTPDFIVNLALHKYPRYIPYPILQRLQKSKSEKLNQLVQKHHYLFAAICWKVLNVLSNTEFLFKYRESEGNLQYAIEDEEYIELEDYSGFRFKEGTYTGEQYLQSGISQVFGIDLSIHREEIDSSVYADPEDLENESDYEP